MPSPKYKRRPGAHFEWSFVDGPIGRSMTPVQWTFYSKMWALSSHEGRKIVCRMRYSDHYLANFMGLQVRTLRKLLAELVQGGCKNAGFAQLMVVTEHYIKVNGIEKIQPWLLWKEPHPCCAAIYPITKTKTITSTKTITTLTVGRSVVEYSPEFDQAWKD